MPIDAIKDKTKVIKEKPALITKGVPPVTLPPNTTEQEDLTTAGQRKVNLIWEYTQAFIAIVVVTANMAAGLLFAFNGEKDNVPAILSSSLFLVIGFYFARSNHVAIGGVGKKPPQQEYKGR